MKTLLTYLIVSLCTLCVYGQPFIDKYDSTSFFFIYNYDTVVGEIPDGNNFTGNIEVYKIDYFTRKHDLLLRPGEKTYTSQKKSISMYESGKLLNGSKIGRWERIVREGSVVATEITEYKNDTIVFRPALPFGREYFFIGDSSEIYGRINTTEFDDIYEKIIISFHCKNKRNCVFRTNNNEIILEANYTDLEVTIEKFEKGGYNRKIRFLNE